jgi:hypothetical protein
MKEEYREKLNKVIELFLFWGAAEEEYERGEEKEFPLSEKETDRRYHMFDELIECGDPEVLHGLMGLLTMKVGGGSALDEHFEQQIFNYYSHEQIAEAIFDKFDAIYENDERPDGIIRTAYVLEGICSELWDYGRTEEGFQIFRQMFNTVRPRHAKRFLDEMEKYKVEEEKPMIQTLREDMAQWGSEEGGAPGTPP